MEKRLAISATNANLITQTKTTMFLYTYNLNIQGCGNSHYIHLTFNRTISPNSVYRKGICREGATVQAKRIMDSVAQVAGVVRTDSEQYGNHAELIHLTGGELTFKTTAITVAEKRAVISRVVKRIQAIIAPDECRKCIRMSKLRKEIAAANARLK